MQEAPVATQQREAMRSAPPFVFGADQVILSGRPKGAELLQAITQHMERQPENQAVPLDFSHISFIDVSCADELLSKLLLRIRSGELGQRFIYIQGYNSSLGETIEAVLQLRGLCILSRAEDAGQLLGDLKRPLREALDVVLEGGSITSAAMAEALGKNVNIVCNRLNALQRMGLVCRRRDDTVSGGGRQYCYVALF